MLNSDAWWVRALTFVASLLGGAAIWEVIGWNANNAFMASFSSTLLRLLEMVDTGEFTAGLASSLTLFGTGFGIAISISIPLGILIARLSWLRVGLESYLLAIYATPMVAIIPFILAIFGYDFWPKVLVVVLFSAFPVLFNTIEGARSINPELVEVAHAFGSSERSLWWDVVIPWTLPYAMTGIRQGIGRGLVGMVAAEFFLSASGLGELIIRNSRDFDMAGVLAAILIITLLGAVLMGLGRLLEYRFAAWRGLNR